MKGMEGCKCSDDYCQKALHKPGDVQLDDNRDANVMKPLGYMCTWIAVSCHAFIDQEQGLERCSGHSR